MVARALAMTPMRVRRRVYASILGTGVLLGLASGVWSVYARSDYSRIPSPSFPALVSVVVVAFVVAALLGLLWLRPHRLLYALGLCFLMLASFGPWLAVSGLLLHWPASGQQLGWLSLLFPVAWLLLAGSIGEWKVGLLSYVVGGFTFNLMVVVGGLLAPAPPWGRPLSLYGDWARYQLPFMWLLWPQYALGMLGVSYWAPPVGQ